MAHNYQPLSQVQADLAVMVRDVANALAVIPHDPERVYHAVAEGIGHRYGNWRRDVLAAAIIELARLTLDGAIVEPDLVEDVLQ